MRYRTGRLAAPAAYEGVAGLHGFPSRQGRIAGPRDDVSHTSGTRQCRAPKSSGEILQRIGGAPGSVYVLQPPVRFVPSQLVQALGRPAVEGLSVVPGVCVPASALRRPSLLGPRAACLPETRIPEALPPLRLTGGCVEHETQGRAEFHTLPCELALFGAPAIRRGLDGRGPLCR